MATVLPPPSPSPNPEKEKLFELLRTQKSQQQKQSEIETEEEQSELVPGIGYIEDGPGLIPEGSNEFGLTAKDALFIEYDIRKAIEDFDRKHGFDGIGFYDEYGNYIYSVDRVNKLDDKRRNIIHRSNKVGAQNVAIKKGLIKIHRPSDDEVTKEADSK